MSDPTTPPSVQNTLGAAGACPEIPLDGRVWRVGHPTQRAKAALEEFAAAAAVNEALALKGVLPPAAYQELFAATARDVQAKAFRTWGPGWQRVVFDPLNSHLFLWSLLRENHPDATEADARRLMAAEPDRVSLALARVVPDFFRMLLDGLGLTADRRAAAEEAIRAFTATLSPQPPTPPTA